MELIITRINKNSKKNLSIPMDTCLFKWTHLSICCKAWAKELQNETKKTSTFLFAKLGVTLKCTVLSMAAVPQSPSCRQSRKIQHGTNVTSNWKEKKEVHLTSQSLAKCSSVANEKAQIFKFFFGKNVTFLLDYQWNSCNNFHVFS